MILSLDDLAFYRSKPVVYLDGAFDPLHAGHVGYLTSAVKAFPDHLCIVGIASDDDIRAKGREPLLDQRSRAKVVESLKCVDLVVLKNDPTEHILGKLRPGVYVKGKDWEGRLPAEQLAVCSLQGIQIVYLDTVTDSATDRLRAWARAEDAEYLYRLECLVQSQKPASTPWQPVTDYSFEARKAIEGVHPRRIKEVFHPLSVLDVGCGPYGHLIRLLREIGVSAEGFDVQERHVQDLRIWQGDIAGEPNEIGRFDLVVCREVLEHMTIRQVRQAVTNLCKLSSKFVYVTTRFAKNPGALLSVDTSDDLDPTHITMLNQDFLRALFVLEGAKRRADLEQRMDWQNKGRVLVYEVT